MTFVEHSNKIIDEKLLGRGPNIVELLKGIRLHLVMLWIVLEKTSIIKVWDILKTIYVKRLLWN